MMDFKSTINFVPADRAVTAGLVDGLDESLHRVLDVSSSRVPTDTGKLKASGRVVVDSANLTGAVTYDADYAAIVHERMDLAHDDGEAKFLESAQNSERGAIGETLAAAARRRT